MGGDDRPDFQHQPLVLGKLEGTREGIGGISCLAKVISVDVVRQAVAWNTPDHSVDRTDAFAVDNFTHENRLAGFLYIDI